MPHLMGGYLIIDSQPHVLSEILLGLNIFYETYKYTKKSNHYKMNDSLFLDVWDQKNLSVVENVRWYMYPLWAK